MPRSIVLLVLLSALLAAGPRPAAAHEKTLVVKSKHDEYRVTVTLASRSPRAGQDVALTVQLVSQAHEGGKHVTVPVTDARVQAHLGHGDDASSTPLTHDGAKPGTYNGSIAFEHAGKETFHVGITPPGAAKEWTVRVAVTVARADK